MRFSAQQQHNLLKSHRCQIFNDHVVSIQYQDLCMSQDYTFCAFVPCNTRNSLLILALQYFTAQAVWSPGSSNQSQEVLMTMDSIQICWGSRQSTCWPCQRPPQTYPVPVLLWVISSAV